MDYPFKIDTKVSNKKLSDRFYLPITVLEYWTKEYESSWKKKLIQELKQIKLIEDIILSNLKKKFNEKEILALISSINTTIPDNQFFTMDNFWSWHFKETCIYEPMLVKQFLEENETLETFEENLSIKLNELDLFSKYVLFKFVFNFWSRDNKVKNLDEYIKKWR